MPAFEHVEGDDGRTDEAKQEAPSWEVLKGTLEDSIEVFQCFVVFLMTTYNMIFQSK